MMLYKLLIDISSGEKKLSDLVKSKKGLDGIKNAEKEGTVKVLDIAELIANAADL